MHYGVTWSRIRPTFLRRESWTLFARNSTNSLISMTAGGGRDWNPTARTLDWRSPVPALEQEPTTAGLSTSEGYVSRAVDVNLDGLTDVLVAASRSGSLQSGRVLQWASGASGGWIPLAPGGTANQLAGVSPFDVAFGNFDATPGFDVVAIVSSKLRFLFSDGSARDVPLSGVTDVEIFRNDADTLDDVFVVVNGNWLALNSTTGFDPGLAVPLANGMGISEITLTDPTGSGVVVATGIVLAPNGTRQLSSAPTGGSGGWVPLPVVIPSQLRTIDEVSWVDWDAPTSPGEPKDAAFSSGPNGLLQIAVDAATTSSIANISMTQFAGLPVPARTSMVGHFNSATSATVLTGGTLTQRNPNFETIRRSDLITFRALYHSRPTGSYLYYKYPFTDTVPFNAVETVSVSQGADVPFLARFQAEEGVHSGRLTIEKSTSSGFVTISDETQSGFSSSRHEFELDFATCDVGTYRVTISVLDPAPNLTALPSSLLSLNPVSLSTDTFTAQWIVNVLPVANIGPACPNTKSLDRLCGNAILDVVSGEQCDDGNRVDGDTCTSDCRLPVCGDGHVSAGEQCDDGNTGDGDACTSVCTNPVCGDGHVSVGEACDDGNLVNLDGCSSSCSIEVNTAVCGNSVVEAGEVCDDGPLNSTNGTCSFAGQCVLCQTWCLE